MAHISYTETYQPARDGLAPLALPLDLERRLADALHQHDYLALEQRLARAITVQIQLHGVDEHGRWLGDDWSAEEIVSELLA